jgi:TetR/AcrR family fatty acid metabolism transcriptional regulator
MGARGASGRATPSASDRTVAWRRRKDFRQAEILEAARTLLEEEGTAATSMARIAREAGVSEATVYKYFDNKQDLINQVLHEWAMPFIERLSTELAQLVELRPRLILIAVRYLRSMEETPKLHRVFFQELRWTDYRGSPLHVLNHRFAHNVTATVENGVRSGELAPNVEPAVFRDMLFGGLEHISMRTSFMGRPVDVVAQATRYVDMMLRGALARPAVADMPAELTRLAGLLDRMERALG